MAENSQIYMPLATSPTFTNRVQYILVEAAPVVLTEASTNSVPPNTYTAAGHTLRASLAASVVKNPASFAAVFAVHLAANINVITAGALTGTVSAGTLDTPALDNALLAAVASLWSTVAGVIVNP